MAEHSSTTNTKRDIHERMNTLNISRIPAAERRRMFNGLRRTRSHKHATMTYDVNKKFTELVMVEVYDITALSVDAIVTSANLHLQQYGEVNKAIHDAAGPELLIECERIAPCFVGEAKITNGYNLIAKHVIHTTCPNSVTQGAKKLLEKCYINSLTVALLNDIESIAFPCIGSGGLGFPIEVAADVAVRAIRTWLKDEDNGRKIKSIVLALPHNDLIPVYKWAIKNHIPTEMASM